MIAHYNFAREIQSAINMSRSWEHLCLASVKLNVFVDVSEKM